MEIQEVSLQKKEQLAKLAQELYEVINRRIIPKYPWILTRVVPKETRSKAGVVLIDSQNKLMYEGVVLETWKPFWKRFRTKSHTCEGIDCDPRCNLEWEESEILTQSEFTPGDFILFPHYEGLPVAYLSQADGDVTGREPYRLVREFNPADQRCEIMATLDCKQDVRELLRPMMGDVNADELLEKFYVIPKELKPVTLSGK